MQGIEISIVRWVDDDQPGWVECVFFDDLGNEHRVREKGRYRTQDGYVIVRNERIEPIVSDAVSSPLTLIVSGAYLDERGHGHPRASGAHARVLGHYVRERGVLPMMDALRKMSLMPARLLERRAPSLEKKGRLREGGDADIVMFDSRRIIDRSTFSEPTRPSQGVRHVLINGVLVVRDGVIQQGVVAGRAVRTPIF